MAEKFKEKLRSLSFSRPVHRQPKTSTDEQGNTVTEHWHDRQDVTIKAPTVEVTMRQREAR